MTFRRLLLPLLAAMCLLIGVAPAGAATTRSCPNLAATHPANGPTILGATKIKARGASCAAARQLIVKVHTRRLSGQGPPSGWHCRETTVSQSQAIYDHVCTSGTKRVSWRRKGQFG